jgi:hypothetical protein
MTHERIKTAFEMAGAKVIRVQVADNHTPDIWQAHYGTYRAEWTPSIHIGQTDFIHIKDVRSQDEPQSDYFPGFFKHTIKGAVKSLIANGSPK